MALNTMFLITLSAAVVVLVSAASPPFQERKAIVVFKSDKVSGNVTFIQPNRGGPVTVTGIINGLNEGRHGFHVHEKGDLTSGCASTGSHFNPQMKNHGGPSDETRHAGDLGNIVVDNTGLAQFSFQDSLISLVGAHNILGRAVVIHADEDDLGRRGFSDSLTTGHAGSRVACGVIGLLAPVDAWDKSSGHRSSPASHVLLLTTVAAMVSALTANFF